MHCCLGYFLYEISETEAAALNQLRKENNGTDSIKDFDMSSTAIDIRWVNAKKSVLEPLSGNETAVDIHLKAHGKHTALALVFLVITIVSTVSVSLYAKHIADNALKEKLDKD
eukprot:g2844.t1